MKLKFLHDSMRFNQETAREEIIKKGQTVEIPDEDAGAFLSGVNPRAEIVSTKEKKEWEEENKSILEAQATAKALTETPQPKAKATHTKKATTPRKKGKK
jgi:hypothetical protein